MGPDVLTIRSFQVVLTEMGLPIHPALLCARTPEVMPSVFVTMLLFSAWPEGEAGCTLDHRRSRSTLQSDKLAAEAAPEFALRFHCGTVTPGLSY